MKRDASNAQAPRNAAAPAVRPSAEGCSNRDVVSSDASNAHAPHTASAMANDDEDDVGTFNQGLADGDAVLEACALNRDDSRGICRVWNATRGVIACGRIQVDANLTDTTRRGNATCSAWRARPGSSARVVECLCPLLSPQERRFQIGSTISNLLLDTFGPPLVVCYIYLRFTPTGRRHHAGWGALGI